MRRKPEPTTIGSNLLEEIVKSANLPKSAGLSVAGQALTKHPHLVGVAPGVSLTKELGGAANVNSGATKLINNIAANGKAVTKDFVDHRDGNSRVIRIIEAKLPNGEGFRSTINGNRFIGFTGRPSGG